MDSSQNKRITKKEKTPLQEFEFQVKDIRQQFLEQVKCLEQRTESQTSLLSELQDFYKRRADIELDYSKNLDKLSKHLSTKQKAEKQKREGWTTFSLHSHYLQAIEEVKSEAKHRSALADLYINHISSKLTNQAEELQRISKKCREISVVAQQEIIRVLGELHTAMKTYQLCQAASWAAENKFRNIEAQKCKFEEANPKKIGRRKHRFLEKEYERKRSKYAEFQLKALKAKNEYLLCIDAANAALHKYFADDLSDLLDCMDVGCEEWLNYLLSTVTDCRQAVLDSDTRHVQICRDFSRDLDHRADKRRFLDANHSTFMLPRKFEFKPHFSDTESHRVRAQKSFQDDYAQRYWQINHRLTQLKTETEEVWKTLETAEKTLMDIQKLPEIKWPDLFSAPSKTQATANSLSSGNFNSANVGSSANNSLSMSANNSNVNNSAVCPGEISRRNSCRETDVSQQKRKQDLVEIEDFYLQKFKEYLIAGNLIRRLEARQEAIRCALGVPPIPTSASNTLSVTGMPNYCSPFHNQTSSHENSRCESASGESGATQNQLHKCSFPTITAGAAESSPSPNLNSDSSYAGPAVPAGAVRTRRKKRIGVSAQTNGRKRPKLFGGSIEEYVEATGQDVPLIIRSCVRMLSLHGLHHQGVFRVSGSQIEINSFKDSFERGDDPLSGVADSSDVNSVAGVLKLYFRELREPLFPIFMFDQFVECSRIENKDEFAHKVQELVLTLPRPVFVVMRYLFAFLNHLSEFSDENMMDPFNLAICFGPTLLPIPESRDQVFFHNHVNELMKNMIIYHEEIFPKVIDHQPSGTLYEKYMLAADNSDETPGGVSLMPASESNKTVDFNGCTKLDQDKPTRDEIDDEEVYDNDDDEDQGNNTDEDEQDDEILADSFADNFVSFRAVQTDSQQMRPSSQNGACHSTPRSNKQCPSPNATTHLSHSHLSCDTNSNRKRSISTGSAPVEISLDVDPRSSSIALRDINALSMHNSLRAIDSPPLGIEIEENKIANTDIVWLRRPSLAAGAAQVSTTGDRLSNESGQQKSPKAKGTRSPLLEAESRSKNNLQRSNERDNHGTQIGQHLRSQNDPTTAFIQENNYSLYSNLHTSITSSGNSFSKLTKTPEPSPVPSLLSSSCIGNSFVAAPSYSKSRPSNDYFNLSDNNNPSEESCPLETTSFLGRTAYTKPMSESLPLKQCNEDNNSAFRVPSKAPIHDRYNFREIENRSKNVGANRYSAATSTYGYGIYDSGGKPLNIFKPIGVPPPPVPVDVSSLSPKVVTNPSYNSSTVPDLTALRNAAKYNSADLCRHYPPQAHSPTSLNEIQVELKAVLSSLESFANQHQRKDVPSSDFDATEVERRFGLRGYLQENSRLSKQSDSPATDFRRNTVVRPPDLVQNLPLPSTVDCRDSELGSAATATSIIEEPRITNSGHRSTTIKPPVPRKPSVSSLSSSPQISRRETTDNSDNDQPAK